MVNMEQSTMTFGAWLRGRRAERRLSQVEAAECIGISANRFAKWENDNEEPIKLVHIRKLARWGGATVPELLPMLKAGLPEDDDGAAQGGG